MVEQKESIILLNSAVRAGDYKRLCNITDYEYSAAIEGPIPSRQMEGGANLITQRG